MFNKRLIKFVPEAFGKIALKVGVMWLSLLCNIAIWFSLAYFAQEIYNGTCGKRDYINAVCIIVLCCIVRFICTYMTSVCAGSIAETVKLKIRNDVYTKLVSLGSEYKNVLPTAEIIQLASEGAEQTETYFAQYLPQLFYSVLAPVTLFFTLVGVSPKCAVVLLICVPLIPVSIAAVQTVAKRLLSKYWQAYAGLGDSFLENLQGLTTLKVYGADGYKHDCMNEEAEQFRKITMKVLSMQLNSVTVMDIAAYGGAALGMCACCADFAAGNTDIGGAIAAVFLASEFFIPMRLLGSYFHIAMNGAAASEKLFKLFDAPVYEDGTKPAQSSDIRLENVSLEYDRKVLDNISLCINKGDFIGICGKSGCGKSTLAAIICGRNNRYRGGVYIGGENFKNVSYRSKADTVMYVGCDEYIFTGTVRSCLCEAEENADDERMYEVLRSVNLEEFVKQNGGLDMTLLQNGANLSGGQKQRLALARALMKRSEMYIFDEITSNIDSESERIILEAINRMKKSYTVIIISHKLSNISNTDMIYFMENGKIAECGTHDYLMSLGGEYKKIYTYQHELENYSKG